MVRLGQSEIDALVTMMRTSVRNREAPIAPNPNIAPGGLGPLGATHTESTGSSQSPLTTTPNVGLARNLPHGATLTLRDNATPYFSRTVVRPHTILLSVPYGQHPLGSPISADLEETGFWSLLEPNASQRPTEAQLFARDPAELAFALDKLPTDPFEVVDITSNASFTQLPGAIVPLSWNLPEAFAMLTPADPIPATHSPNERSLTETLVSPYPHTVVAKDFLSQPLGKGGTTTNPPFPSLGDIPSSPNGMGSIKAIKVQNAGAMTSEIDILSKIQQVSTSLISPICNRV